MSEYEDAAWDIAKNVDIFLKADLAQEITKLLVEERCKVFARCLIRCTTKYVRGEIGWHDGPTRRCIEQGIQSLASAAGTPTVEEMASLAFQSFFTLGPASWIALEQHERDRWAKAIRRALR